MATLGKDGPLIKISWSATNGRRMKTNSSVMKNRCFHHVTMGVKNLDS